MKTILFLFISAFAFTQNPNHQILVDHNWRLNFVQDGDNEPVYVASEINYPIQFSSENEHFRHIINICNWHNVDFSYVNNENAFLYLGAGSTLAVCDGPPYPENIMFFDAFVSNFPIFTSPNEQFPFELTTLPSNQYRLDIYNPTGKRLNFNSTGLSVNNNSIDTFNIFPNPVSDILNISSNSIIQNLSIYNMNGQKVIETNTSLKQIDISNFSSGVYLLKVVGENEEIIYKKIVKK